MLSYRHSYHAGNFADVLKHVVLVEILQYLKRKDSALEYIDSHAGAGLFDLHSAHAEKLAEYRDGIARLYPSVVPELADYLAVVAEFNQGIDSNAVLNHYPGSPMIARQLLRPQDKASLFELHSNDYELLQQQLKGDARFRVQKQDGLEGLLALLPPRSRRALILIDPSYELKTEYQQVLDTLIEAQRKFASGIYAIWYPVIERQRTEDFIRQMQQSGIRNIQRFELTVRADTAGRGMTAAGMLVINPPWTLLQTMQALLPVLVSHLARDPQAFYRAEVLVNE